MRKAKKKKVEIEILLQSTHALPACTIHQSTPRNFFLESSGDGEWSTGSGAEIGGARINMRPML